MCDIFVLPSDIEGLSNAMLEAMATGLITIVTDVPGAREVIDDGKNGFIVERSTESLRKGLLKALKLSRNASTEMSQNARNFIKGSFNIEKGSRETLKVLGIAHKPLEQ
jgi:galacturonosyltransferase